MNKLIQLSILACGTTASAITQIDTSDLSQKVMEKVSQQVLEMNLKPLIDAEVEKRVGALLAGKEAADINKFRQFTGDDWIKYDQLQLHQKLSNVLDDLEKDTVIDSMFKGASEEAKNAALRKFFISFDLDEGNINISSKAKDADGKPLFDWKFDKQQGEITHIQRVPILNPSKIVEQSRKERNGALPAPQEILEKIIKETPIEDIPQKNVEVVDNQQELTIPFEQPNMEMQRDLGFKIVFCFAAFIIGSFGLLYSYFIVDQKQQGQKQSNYSFSDFLAGKLQPEIDSDKQDIILKSGNSNISRRNATEHEF